VLPEVHDIPGKDPEGSGESNFTAKMSYSERDPSSERANRDSDIYSHFGPRQVVKREASEKTDCFSPELFSDLGERTRYSRDPVRETEELYPAYRTL